MRNRKIAVTGGIGSGKSEVVKIIEKCGYPVYSCDEIYGEMLQDGQFVKKLENAFPEAIVGGQLDKKRLAEIVFSDEKRREKLNEIAHPEIMKRAMCEMARSEVSFLEVPLLFEGGLVGLFDSVWVVVRDRAKRIAAVRERGLSEKEAEARFSAQFDYDGADLSAYEVIENNGGKEELADAVSRLLGRL